MFIKAGGGEIIALHKVTCDTEKDDDGWLELDDYFFAQLERGIEKPVVIEVDSEEG